MNHNNLNQLVQTARGDWILVPKRKKQHPSYYNYATPSGEGEQGTGKILPAAKARSTGADDGAHALSSTSSSAALRLLSPTSAAEAARLGVELEAFPLLQLHLIPVLPEGILVASLRALLPLVPSAVSSKHSRTDLSSAAKVDTTDQCSGDRQLAPASATEESPLEVFATKQIEHIADELRRRHNEKVELPEISRRGAAAASGRGLLQQSFKR